MDYYKKKQTAREGQRKIFSTKKYRPHFIIILIIIAVLFLGRYCWREYRWRFIVIHHTASESGNLDYIRKIHIKERGWHDIAYHFVINNGSMGTAPGQIEISDLWLSREANLSTQLNYVNIFAISVVLIGNFENQDIPHLQKESLIRLLTNLSIKYGIPPERVIGHGEIQNTACPGGHIDMNGIRHLLRQKLSEIE